MPVKMTCEEFKRRYALLNREDIFDETTYIKASTKARFIDPKYGEFWVRPCQILNKKQIRHKARQVERCLATKKKNNSFKPGLKKPLPVEIIEKKIQERNPKISIVRESYTKVRDKCWFIEEGYGLFQSTADRLIRGQCKGFPRRKERTEETLNQKTLINPNWKQELVEKTKKTLKERYGEKGIRCDLIQNKVKATILARYGVIHPNQSPKIALKVAKSSNNCYILTHWQTNEKLVCVASYEASVVLYFNKNRINYLFQHKTFNLPNLKTTYRPDFYLPDQDLWIEVKGYFRKDAKEKWEEFHGLYPNSELWEGTVLFKLGLINKHGRPINKESLKQYRYFKSDDIKNAA